MRRELAPALQAAAAVVGVLPENHTLSTALNAAAQTVQTAQKLQSTPKKSAWTPSAAAAPSVSAEHPPSRPKPDRNNLDSTVKNSLAAGAAVMSAAKFPVPSAAAQSALQALNARGAVQYKTPAPKGGFSEKMRFHRPHRSSPHRPALSRGMILSFCEAPKKILRPARMSRS